MRKLSKKFGRSFSVGVGGGLQIGEESEMEYLPILRNSGAPFFPPRFPRHPLVTRSVISKSTPIAFLFGLGSLSKIALSVIKAISVAMIGGDNDLSHDERMQPEVIVRNCVEPPSWACRNDSPAMLIAPFCIFSIDQTPHSSCERHIGDGRANRNKRVFENAAGILSRHGFLRTGFAQTVLRKQFATMQIISFGGAF